MPPVDTQERVRGVVDGLEQEFAQVISCIPAVTFLEQGLQDRRMAMVHKNVLDALEEKAKPVWQKGKAPKKIDKMEVKHTDTSKGLSGMKERFANITPSLPYFDLVDELSAEKRKEGVLALLDHLKAVATNEKDEVDGEHDVTEYTLKRLLRGTARREGGTRIGSALALALFMKECPNIDPAGVISMSKKILVSASSFGDKDVAWGKAFVYAAVVFSGRMYEKDQCEKVVTALLDIRKQTFVRQFVTQLLGVMITKCSTAVVQGQIYTRVREGLKEPENYTPELLYLALKIQTVLKGNKREMSEELTKLMGRKFWEQELLVSMQPSLVETAFHFHPQVHVMWGAMLQAVFESSKDSAEVAENFKAFWKIMIDDTIRDSTKAHHATHVRNNLGKEAVVYIEALEDETVRNQLLYFLHKSWPNLVFDGLWGLIKSKQPPMQSVDNLIQQFWHISAFGPEDEPGDGDRKDDDDESESEADSDDDDPLRATLRGKKKYENYRPGGFGAKKKKRKSDGPTGRGSKFSYFRTVVQRYIIHALKIHVAQTPECMEQVMEFCMNMGLFCVPSDVERREVVRRGDVRWVITVELFDFMLSLLQTLAGYQPQIVWTSVKMLLDKEKAYDSRYEPLPADNVVTEARTATVKNLKALKALVPKQLNKPGFHSAHQAYSQLLGMSFFYLSVIQDEGIGELVLDMCQYCEENIQDLAADMDILIDFIIAICTYQADLKPKFYKPNHVFKLMQQAASSVFRKTCRHLTMKGLGQILECLEDPMKVLVFDDPDAPAEEDEEEDEDEDEMEGIVDNTANKKGAGAAEKENEKMDEDDEDEEEDDEEEEDDDEEDEDEEEKEEDGDDDDDDDDGEDPDLDTDITEDQMAMILRAHQAVANKKKEAEQKQLANEEIARKVRFKMLDLVGIYISHCSTAGVILDAGNVICQLMSQELRMIEGTRKEQEKRKKKGGNRGMKNTDLYTKLRCMVRDMIATKPRPEVDNDETYTKAAYSLLDHCTKVIKAQDIGTEGGILKTDLFTAAVWTTGNLVKGGSLIKINEKKVIGCFHEMFSSRHLSMRLADLMEDIMKRYLERFMPVFTRFIVPALAQAMVKKQDKGTVHPFTKVVVLKCLNNVLRVVIPHSIYDVGPHVVMLKHINTMLESLVGEELNESATELMLEMSISCLKWDRRQTVQGSIQQLYNAYKEDPDISKKAKRCVHRLEELLEKAGTYVQKREEKVKELAKEKGDTEMKPVDGKEKKTDKDKDKKKKRRRMPKAEGAEGGGKEGEAPAKKQKVEKKEASEKKAQAPKVLKGRKKKGKYSRTGKKPERS